MAEQKDPSPTTNNGTNTDSLAELATLVAATQDALSDDMIARLSSAFSEGIALLDRLTRNEGLMHLLRELDRPENQDFLVSLSDAFTKANKEIAVAPPAKGGVIKTYQLIRDPSMQEGLQLVSLVSKYLSKSMRELQQAKTT